MAKFFKRFFFKFASVLYNLCNTYASKHGKKTPKLSEKICGHNVSQYLIPIYGGQKAGVLRLSLVEIIIGLQQLRFGPQKHAFYSAGQ